MKHLKNNCTIHDLILADCGLACANCGMCKCGKVHHEEEKIEAKKRLDKITQSNRLTPEESKEFRKMAEGALNSLRKSSLDSVL